MGNSNFGFSRGIRGNCSSIWIQADYDISALLFAIGHMASALSGASGLYVILQVINAFVFGILAAEIVFITNSLIPTIIWHFAFNFINHITLASGVAEIIVVGLQVIIMIIYISYLWIKISLNKSISYKPL